MNVNLKYVNAILFPISLALLGYSTCTSIKDAQKYKDVDDLKTEISQKAPNLYDSLKNDNVLRASYQDWQYEVDRMNDSIKTDSMIQRAYFEGAQMVRDSLKGNK